jgi:hypothetical protein
MNGNASNETPAMTKRALCVSMLVLAACGQQAGGDYRGEPLLRMRGQAVVSALTGGQAIEPALCFFLADLPKAPVFDLNKIPAAIRERLTYQGESLIEVPQHRHGRMATHILDVESRGSFPAQFDVDVYLPPPSSGLSSPVLPGEPRWAAGFVCAVPAEHPAVTFAFAQGGGGSADGSRFDYVIASLTTPRFYYEAYECPVGTLPQLAKSVCNKTSAGDPSLAYEFPTLEEFRSESVLGTALGFEVVYLDQAALPGSHTAWRWGAANGLSAGYHLIQLVPPLPGVPPDHVECMAAASTAAEELNNELYGPRIKQMFGDDYSYNALTAYKADGGSVLELPEDIYLGARENEARLQMQHCPLKPRTELDPSTASLSIDIASNATADLSSHLGMVTIGGEASATNGREERE